MSVIEELWYGDLDPQEKSFGEDPKIQEMQLQAMRTYEKLKAELSDEDFEKVEKHLEETEKINAAYAKNAFTYGFRIGMRFVIESFKHD